MNQPYKKYDPSTFSLWDNYAPAMEQKAPENTQSYNRYAYCLNNPMKYTDPSGFRSNFTVDGVFYWGMDATWFLNHNLDNISSIEWGGRTLWNADKNEPLHYNSRKGEFGTYFDGGHQSAKDYHTYLSSSLFGSDYGKDGVENHLSYSTPFNIELDWAGFSPSDIIRYGSFEKTTFRQEKSFWEIMASDGDFGYDGDPGHSSLPDMVAVQISGNYFVGGGFGADITLGYVKGEGYFMNATGKAGPGVDVSVGFSFVTGDYTGKGNPTGSSLGGFGTFQNAGVGILTVSKSQDISQSTGKIGQNWNTTSYGACFGSKTIIGGAGGISYTTPDFFHYLK